MTFPIDIHLGSLVIPSHLFFEFLAFYAAFQYYLILKKRHTDPLSENNRWLVIVGAALGALIGSRLLAALELPGLFFDPPTLLYYYANKTIVGALIGGILGVEIMKKICGEKSSSGDLFTFPLIFGIIVGRIGCFLTGVSDGTVGNPSSLPWAFDQGDGIARHPTSGYEIIFLLVLWIILYRFQKKYPLKNGVVFRLCVIGYLGFRFLIEFIKPVEPLIASFSAIQWASLLFVFYYVIQLSFWAVDAYKAKPA
jgi:phosphatidylglycerol---prolipoprotein diacylglyceryl transferase